MRFGVFGPDASWKTRPGARSLGGRGADGKTVGTHEVYDPAAGARVVSGPAPQPLAAILLDYDGATDGVAALGTVGAEQFDAFFRKYDFKLTMEYGQGKARMPVGATTVVRELTQYCRQTIQC